MRLHIYQERNVSSFTQRHVLRQQMGLGHSARQGYAHMIWVHYCGTWLVMDLWVLIIERVSKCTRCDLEHRGNEQKFISKY